jgi:hypothetical protein
MAEELFFTEKVEQTPINDALLIRKEANSTFPSQSA